MSYALILCGGTGERLWPHSLPHRPKQFCNLLDENKNMLDLTLERLPPSFSPLLIGNEKMREHLDQYQSSYPVIYEPYKKNTGISILLGLLTLQSQVEKSANPLIMVLPCDHYFDLTTFQSFLTTELTNVSELTLIGIQPTRPETGFGYIGHSQGKITKFEEKPTVERASELINDGYLWNSGIFIAPFRTFLALYHRYLPLVSYQLERALQYSEPRLFNSIFSSFPDISFDKAIMEPYGQGEVLFYSGEWNDLGSWNRVAITNNKAIQVNCSNCVSTVDSGTVIMLGLSDVIVAKRDNNILISHSEHTETVKEALKQLSSVNYRPWGYYEDLVVQETLRFKRIVVYPHQRLSLQYHDYRQEVWFIKSGTGVVRIGEEEFLAEPGSTFTIPIKAIHRITNNSSSILEFYEIQSGSKVIEEDIHRLEDDYGR